MINSSIEEIKSRLDIVQVIGSYIKLSKTGANLRGLCPFHHEKKPSFFVSPARQIWHCFGCGLGGDIFKFIMQIENVEFGDALRILAQKAGVELKPISQEIKTERSRLYEICELATKFFEKQLKESKRGKEARQYLLKRGINEESIESWRLGYSPDTWQGLCDFLVSQGYKREEIEKAGLAIKNEKGNYYDRFRGRIIFPVFDLNSQVVGFGGRIFGEKSKNEIAKYVNTPNTLLYDKSKILYGLDKTKMEIRNKNECVLVEGYTDAILLYQAGYKNVVASSGTALTEFQLKMIKRYSENLIISFDMDPAGDSATKRGIDLAQIMGFNIKVLLLPEDSDPADIISQNPKDWEKILSKGKSILEFYFESAFSKHNPQTLAGKKRICSILLPVIKRIPNEIEKSFWIQELSKKLALKEEDIREELKKIKIDESNFILEDETILKPAFLPKKREELLEERLLTLILKQKNIQNLDFVNQELNIFSPKLQTIFACLKEKFNEDSKLELNNLNEECANFLNYCYLKAELEEIEPENLLYEVKNCINEIKSLQIRYKLSEISNKIKKAEENREFEKINELLQEFNHCSKLLCNLEQINPYEKKET